MTWSAAACGRARPRTLPRAATPASPPGTRSPSPAWTGRSCVPGGPASPTSDSTRTTPVTEQGPPSTPPAETPDPTPPPHWEADIVAADGGTVHLRPICPEDADGINGLMERSSDQTRYYRFFGPMKRLSEKDLHRFTHVDYVDRVAFVLVLGDQVIGVGRYDRLPDTAEAEVAFLIEDAHQGRGLGSVLLEHLAAAGRERGIERFS